MVGGIRPIMCTGPRWSEKTSSDTITLRVDRAQGRCSLIPIGKGCFVYQRNSQTFLHARRLLWRLTFSEITNEFGFLISKTISLSIAPWMILSLVFLIFSLSLNVNQYLLNTEIASDNLNRNCLICDINVDHYINDWLAIVFKSPNVRTRLAIMRDYTLITWY